MIWHTRVEMRPARWCPCGAPWLPHVPLVQDAVYSATADLSMVGNTAFGIRNETHASPFLRKLKGGLAAQPKEAVG